MSERMEDAFAPKSPEVTIPDEVVQGGLSRTLRFIHKERSMRPAGLGKHIPNLEKGNIRDTLTDLPTKDARTVEVNAIAAHVIADVWPQMRTWIQDHPGQVARGADFESNELIEVKEDALRSRFILNHESGFGDLRKYAVDMCQHFVKKEVQTLTTKGDPVVGRLRSLVSNPYYSGYENDPAQLVLAGFVTANDTIWGLLNTIPRAFRQQYGADRQLKASEYKVLAHSAKDLALSMAATQINVFSSIRNRTEGGDYNAFLGKLYLNGISIIEDGGHMRLDFTPEILRAIAKDYLLKQQDYEQRIRTGCPALFVSGAEGSNVISDYFDWCYSLAEKYYIPTLHT